jgi:hypothetical protein
VQAAFAAKPLQLLALLSCGVSVLAALRSAAHRAPSGARPYTRLRARCKHRASGAKNNKKITRKWQSPKFQLKFGAFWAACAALFIENA